MFFQRLSFSICNAEYLEAISVYACGVRAFIGGLVVVWDNYFGNIGV